MPWLPTVTSLATLGDSVSQTDGWTVFNLGSLCICSASIDTSYINSTYYFFSKDFPVTFQATPCCVGSVRSSEHDLNDSSYAIDFAQTSTDTCAGYVGASTSGSVQSKGVYVICMGLV